MCDVHVNLLFIPPTPRQARAAVTVFFFFKETAFKAIGLMVGGWRRFGHKEQTTRWRFCPACCSREKAGDAGIVAPCGAVAAPAGPGISGGEALPRVPPQDPCWAARLDVPVDSAAHSRHRPGQRSSPQEARGLRPGPA